MQGGTSEVTADPVAVGKAASSFAPGYELVSTGRQAGAAPHWLTDGACPGPELPRLSTLTTFPVVAGTVGPCLHQAEGFP